MIRLSEIVRAKSIMPRYDKLPLLNDGDTTDSSDTSAATYGAAENSVCNVQVSDASTNAPQNEPIPEARPVLPAASPLFVYILTFLSTIGGFLFGYDTGVVSGALILVRNDFSLTTVWQELFVSITIAFAAIFAFLAGPCNERFGRRPVVIAASAVFTVGALILAMAFNKWMLLAGRAVLGMGIGFASMTVPVYIAECAPSHLRGRLIVVNNLFITGGQFVASVVDGLFGPVHEGWRYMLGLAAVPAVIQFIGFLFMPESPRWLVGKERVDEAALVLRRIRGGADVDVELQQIRTAVDESKVHGDDGWVLGRALRSGPVRRALLVGCGLQVIQQVSGINTVMYYSASIIKMAGVRDDTTAIWLAAATAGVNFVFTLVGLVLVERLGRRRLTLASLVGTTLSLALLATAFKLAAVSSPSVDFRSTPLSNYTHAHQCQSYSVCDSCVLDPDCGFCFTQSNDHVNGTCLPAARSHGAPDPTESGYGECAHHSDDGWNWGYEYCPSDLAWVALLGLLLYLASFAPGMGPMPWTINSEIYPLWARSLGTSLSTGCNWSFNLLVSMTFLTLTETITRFGAFLLYTCLAFIGCIFVLAFVPETKGKRLEEIEQLFAKPLCSSRS